MKVESDKGVCKSSLLATSTVEDEILVISLLLFLSSYDMVKKNMNANINAPEIYGPMPPNTPCTTRRSNKPSNSHRTAAFLVIKDIYFFF